MFGVLSFFYLGFKALGLRASTLRALGYRVEGLFGGLEFMQGWVGERERDRGTDR